MPYFMSDDGLYRHRKVRSLVEPVLAGDLDGIAALGMWDLAGCMSQDTLSDGLVSLPDLISIMLDVSVVRRLADRLVDVGLWHPADHHCDRCEPVPPGHWRFHDWFDMRYKRADVLRTARAKAKELKDEEVVNGVWWRDCIDPDDPKDKNRAYCRYGCGKVLNRYNRSGKDPNQLPSLDHVDPHRARGVTNLVVACGECNRRKWKKTPVEAGLTLQPAPRTPPASTDRSPQTADYGQHTASQTTQDATTALAAAEAGAARQSPHGRDAERHGTPRPPSKPEAESSARPEVIADPDRPPPGTGAGVPARGRGSGSGFEVGVAGESRRQGQPRAAARRRRRRRGGSRSQGEASTDAGAAVRVPEVPVGGSPWHGWHGPPSAISTENVCSLHGLDQPCRKCPGLG